MNIKHFQLRYNGIDFVVDCIPVASLVDPAKKLCRLDPPFTGTLFKPRTEFPEGVQHLAKTARFKKAKHARAAIREAYGYNAEIHDPEYR